MDQKKIMIVEDELVIAMDIRNTLTSYGYKVESIASSGTEAIRFAERNRPDVVLMDIHLTGEFDGIETAALLRKDACIPVIYITALNSSETFKRAQETKPYGYLVKPVGRNDLYTAIETAFDKFQLEQRLKENQDCYEAIFDQATDPILLIDPENGYIMKCNSIAKKYISSTIDPLELSIFEIGLGLPDSTIKKIIENLAPGESTLIETKRVCKSGEIQDITINARKIILNGRNYIQTMIRDISGWKKADQALRISEERLNLAIESTGTGLWEENFITGEIFFNAQVYTMLGYAPYQFEPTYENWLPLVHPEDRNVVTKKYKQYRKELVDSYEVELRLKAIDGRWKWFLARGKIISRDSNGKPEKIIGTNVDITEKKNFEMKLSQSEKRLNFALKGGNLGWFDIDVQAGEAIVNKKTSEIAGYSDQLLHDYDFIVNNIIHPEDKNFFLTESDKCRKGLTSDLNCELRILTPDGGLKWIQVSSMVVERAIDGEPLRSAGTVFDITERKKAEIARNDIFLRYRILLENVSDIIWIYEIETNVITYISPSVTAVCGYTPNELLLQPLEKWITLESIQDAMNMLEKELNIDNDSNPERITTMEIALICSNNKIKLTEGTMKFLRDDSGNPVSILGINRDITERKYQELLLAESEDKFSKAFHLNPSMMAIAKFHNGQLIDVNESFLDATGYTREDVIGRAIYDIEYYADEKENSFIQSLIIKNGRCKNILINIRNSSGDIRNCEFSVESIELKGEHCLLFVIMDITERKKIEEALRTSEEKYRLLAENVTDPIWIMDIDTLRINYISPSINRITGNHPEKVIGTHLKRWLNEKDLDFAVNLLREELKNAHHKKPEERKAVTLEFKVISSKGEVFYTEQTMSFLRDSDDIPAGVLGVYRNITERKKAEKQIKESLKEKEILLKEIHHRVKNNFQIITSLLNLQESKIKDKTVLAHFRDYENRIRAMALIHEKLYQSDDLARINFGEYINLMSRELYHTYSCDSDRIRLDISVDDVMLQINQAIPCGMILNELLTNSIKYAFPDNEKDDCIIKVILKKNEKEINLIVSDNGIGLPEEFDISETESLGLKLIYMSAKNQLNGSVILDRSAGTTMTISFREI